MASGGAGERGLGIALAPMRAAAATRRSRADEVISARSADFASQPLSDDASTANFSLISLFAFLPLLIVRTLLCTSLPH